MKLTPDLRSDGYISWYTRLLVSVVELFNQIGRDCINKMYSWHVAVLALATLAAQQVSCKVFDRCGLVEELQKHNLGRMHVLQNWLCLIENESGRDTTKVTVGTNATEYGLFQIESPQWCTPKTKGGRCNVKCEDLTNDNLADDVACAQKVYNSRNSFSPWEGWKEKCRGKPLINVSSCPSVPAN